jgi:catechol 2,3-dioxygenase-like lactoylglutathione lyase family enzyme
MLNETEAIATIAVKDLGRAAAFYADRLGFEEVSREGEEVITYASGRGIFFVYRSTLAGTNEATAATWSVDERFDLVIAQLHAAGVRFEHYDLPGLELEGDVYQGGGMKVAWFKDPDGNVLSVVGR